MRLFYIPDSSGEHHPVLMSNEKMTKPSPYYLISVLYLFISFGLYPVIVRATSIYSTVIQQNPSDKQVLLNGRIWYNQYSKKFGDQFFLTNTYLRGSVTFKGQKFNNLKLQYDIANDELILINETHPIIILNKEMVDSFTLVFENRNYLVINTVNDTTDVLKGYVNILYNGPSTLYVKYIKTIQPLAVDGKYDLFYPEQHVYLRIGTKPVEVNGTRKLLRLLQDKEKEISNFIRTNRLKPRLNYPETFIPVLKYYDSIMN